MPRPDPARRAALARRLARRRFSRRLLWLTAGVLGASVVAAQVAHLLRGGDDWTRFDQARVEVVDVVDGATVVIRPSHGGAEQPVRLIGLAAPDGEDAAPAKTFLARIALHQQCLIRLEPTQSRDADGLLLAHLYLPDKADEINLALLNEGRAYADRRYPHSLRHQFEQAETQARSRRRGFWKHITESQMPPWRQAWLHQLRAARRQDPAPTD